MSTARNLWTKIRRVVTQSVLGVTRKHGLRRTLALESLESRRVLSVSPAQVSINNTNLVIDGSDVADTVLISENEPGIINLVWRAGGERLSQDFAKSDITKILFHGGDGDDTFMNETDLPSSLYGGGGSDKLVGGAGPDFLEGGDGDDKLYGGDGDDRIFGGNGNDVIRGGAGNDSINAQAGDDLIYGDDGADYIVGEVGADRVYGGEGNDSIYGGEGANTLYGDNGDDQLVGGDDADTIYGGNGNDRVLAGGGNDVIRGGAGNDSIFGQTGDDLIYGEDGADYIVGEGGDDRVYGGEDNDSVYGGEGSNTLHGDNGDDLLVGGDDADTIYGDDGIDRILAGGGNDVVRGGAGNDSIDGQSGEDNIFGDAGNDLIYGSDDADTIDGGHGNDQIWAGRGDDVIRGGNDNDYLWGEDGDDLISGDGDNDFLFGGNGNDRLNGDAGDDLLLGDAGEDAINGGRGNDILIGDTGVDALNGAAGEDILIGGVVFHNSALLEALRLVWTNGTSYDHRIDIITSESFSAFLQPERTVFDDYAVDVVLGGDDMDWFVLPGTMSIYDPNGHTAVDGDGHNHSSGGHHNVHVVSHLPSLEGFELLDSLDVIGDAKSGEATLSLIPHADNVSKREEHLSLFELVRYDQVTHYAVKSGNWSDPSVWHDGIVPTNGARVLVPIGVQVNVDRVFTAEIATLRVDGILSFAAQVNTQLKVDTAVVSDSGSLIIGTAANPIAANVTAKLTFTDNGAIDRNWDPFGISRGLITHGAVQMYGAAKATALELVGAVRAGATWLTLSNVPTGWKVGDRVVIAGTSISGNESEERTIRAISGSRILVDALAYDHLTLSSDQSVHIANLTRNIILGSEASVTSQRGHVMFMHNPNVHISYAHFQRLGRTDKSIEIDDPVVDENWKLVRGTGTNPRARYAVHFHRTGTVADGNPATVRGSVVTDNAGWGFVNHSSYVDFTSNAAYDVLGAGFVTEVGDEIGSFKDNIAINIRASGDGIESRTRTQDFGHTGDGFWFQGTGISVVDNVATNAEGHAFVFYTRGLSLNGRKVHFPTANLLDPTIANGADSIESVHVPIREFRGNVGYSSGVGLSVWYNQRNADHSAVSIFESSTFWNNPNGVELPYSRNIIVRDLHILHDPADVGEIGVRSNDGTTNVIYDNLTVIGFHIGVDPARRGFAVVNGGSYAARRALQIKRAVESGRTVIVQGDFRVLDLSENVMKNYVQQHVSFHFSSSEFMDSIDHIFMDSAVVLNYGPYKNQKLFSAAQLATAIPFPIQEEFVPAAYVGLTVAKLNSRYGLKVFGEMVPATARFVEALGGYLQTLPS